MVGCAAGNRLTTIGRHEHATGRGSLLHQLHSISDNRTNVCGACEPEAMSSITYILSFSNAKSGISAFRQGQAIQPTTVQAGGAISPGKIQMRSVVDGI